MKFWEWNLCGILRNVRTGGFILIFAVKLSDMYLGFPSLNEIEYVRDSKSSNTFDVCSMECGQGVLVFA